MDHRQRLRARTAEEIVDSAEALVLARDPAAVTVADIAKGLGMTAGALYRYFPSRDAILARVQARCLRSLALALDEVPAGEPVPWLLALAGAFVGWSRREPGRYHLLARMLATPEPLVDGAALDEVLPGAVAVLRPLHLALARSGLVAPEAVPGCAFAFFTALHGALQVDKLARFVPAASGPRVARTSAEALLLGWGAPPSLVTASPAWEIA